MTQADVTYLPIGSRIPRVLPSDCVLVHNHVRLARRQGTRGFRFWFQPLNATLERCACGWAPETLEHFRVMRADQLP